MPLPEDRHQLSLPIEDLLQEEDEKELEGLVDRLDQEWNDQSEEFTPIQTVNHEDRDEYIRLALVPGVGPRMISALIGHFGSATLVFQATLSQLAQVHRVGPKLSSTLRDAKTHENIERILEHCADHQVSLIVPGDRTYPNLLAELPDAPSLLFLRGSFAPSDQLSIGVVGTRHASYYGRTMAERLSSGLSRYGLTIISGLARGIDAVAHRAALDMGGRTIAVLGGSVTEIYPPEHKDLAELIVEHGALISETPPFSKPKAGVFPQRNRIISGLSIGVIVVEAADRSGSLITARHAAEQGRDVFAVPGPVTSRTSRGCNALIRDGAILIQDAEDVIEHLGPLAQIAPLKDNQVVHHPSELQLNEIEQKVLQAIEAIPTDIDQVIAMSGLPVPRVLSTLSVLEMRGHIVRPSGRTVVRR